MKLPEFTRISQESCSCLSGFLSSNVEEGEEGTKRPLWKIFTLKKILNVYVYAVGFSYRHLGPLCYMKYVHILLELVNRRHIVGKYGELKSRPDSVSSPKRIFGKEILIVG